MTSAEQLRDRLVEAIEIGRFPAGKPLPKLRFLAAEEGVSDHTVRQALGALERAGMIRRHGRAYVPGQIARRNKVILCCQARPDWWWTSSRHDWFAPFDSAFMRETNLALAQVVPAFWQTDVPSHFVRGPAEITRFVAQQGENLAGILVVGQTWDYRDTAACRLWDIIEWLCRFKRPVVWLDAVDEIGPNAHTAPDRAGYSRMVASRTVREFFTRCHFEERNAIRCAVSALHSLGHRRTAIPLFPGDHADRPARVARLAAAATQLGAITVDAVEVPMPAVSVAGDVTTDPAAYQECAGALAKIVHEGRFTALIALSDERARLLYLPLLLAGLRVPDDLSLVSFDNNQRLLYPWQISSVDMGLGSLGYTAYHLLARDVSLRTSGTDHAAGCHLNHFGSLAPPSVSRR
jgi:hypothetical protein